MDNLLLTNFCDDPGTVRGAVFHHLLFARHAVLRANGAWSESLFPGDAAMAQLSKADCAA